jgi:hypothetical protein
MCLFTFSTVPTQLSEGLLLLRSLHASRTLGTLIVVARGT